MEPPSGRWAQGLGWGSFLGPRGPLVMQIHGPLVSQWSGETVLSTQSGSILPSPRAGGAAGTRARFLHLALGAGSPGRAWGPRVPSQGSSLGHPSLQSRRPPPTPTSATPCPLHCCPLRPPRVARAGPGAESGPAELTSSPSPSLPRALLRPTHRCGLDLTLASRHSHAGPCGSKWFRLESTKDKGLSL